MNIITVVPITRQKLSSPLTYFTASEVTVGAIVSVPLRSRLIHAIVTEIRTAEDIKAEIRAAPYEIRKLGKVRAGSFFSSAFIEACRVLSDHYATTMGSIITAMLPESIMENAHRLAPPLALQPSMLTDKPRPAETYAVQGDEPDRMSTWRSLIRQEFARKKSIAIYGPSIEDVRQIYAALEKGIEGYIILLHGSLPKKKMLEAWNTIAETEHPVVIVTTPSFVVLPRGDIESIVIERENGRGWMQMRSPYSDSRRIIETVARAEHKSVYLSDSLLRVETLYRLEKGDITEGTPFKWRSISTAADSLVGMNHDKSATATADTKPAFRVLSPELESLITLNQADSTHLFILTARRGFATLTVCNDCENILKCTKCATPLVLHTSKVSGKNFYMCHSCGDRSFAADTCSVCDGTRLSPLGIGTERVVEEINKAYPNIETFLIDADTTTTEKQIVSTMERWKAKPGSVLIGTESALFHLPNNIEHIAVASLDSLFALPDFRIQERLMYTLIKLRSMATRSVIVQTRKPEEKIFEYGLKGNLSDFYRSILAERKRYEYPPFSLLIKITLEGKKDVIAREMGELQAHFLPHDIEVFPAFTGTTRGTSLIHGVVRINDGHWPDPDLVAKLRALPMNIGVKINPETLL